MSSFVAQGPTQEQLAAVEEIIPEREAIEVDTSMLSIGVVLVRIIAQPLGVLRLGGKRAICDVIQELESDPEARCVIVTGTGRSFSVGSDVNEFEQSATWQRRAALIDQAVNTVVETSRLPFIAACNGLTLGGGAELALACDIRLAADSATFGFPEVSVGSIASAGGTQRLLENVGRGAASLLLFGGQSIDSLTAEKIGLVQRVVDDETLMAIATELATEIAAHPIFPVAASKACLATGSSHGRNVALGLEADLAIASGLTANAAEAQKAFKEKREPNYEPDLEAWNRWIESALDKDVDTT